jgi:hypothetical protein
MRTFSLPDPGINDDIMSIASTYENWYKTWRQYSQGSLIEVAYEPPALSHAQALSLSPSP